MDNRPIAYHEEGMDPLRRRILDLVAEKGETLKSVSLAMGRNHAYLQQYIHSGKPRRLPEDIRYRLAKHLGVDERELRDEEISQSSVSDSFVFAREVNLGYAQDLPVLGRARAGYDGFFFDQGRVNETVGRPPKLTGVRNAFAVYAVGNSMEPRYFEGELLYINPNKPPARGDFVVVECVDGAGWVKRLVRITDTEYVFAQLNPPEERAIPAERIKAVYRIVGSETR